MALDLTGANAQIALIIPGIGITTPQVLQQFATDDVYEVPEIAPVEVLSESPEGNVPPWRAKLMPVLLPPTVTVFAVIATFFP